MTLVGYGALGETCPGQEVWDDTIGACMCPPGMETTGIVGECIAEGTAPGWGTACPPYTRLPSGTNCMCGSGLAYDPAKQMCTREAYGIKGAAPGKPNGGGKLAGVSPMAWVFIAVAAGGLAYIVARQTR